jgi:hypothetical protein
MSKEIFVVGNGASLKDFDFNFLKDKEWIGCCLAYRYWEKTDIYPTHYVNVDSVVLKNNLEDIKNLIINEKCKTFLLNATIIKEWKEIQNYPNVFYLQQFKQSPGHPFRNLIDYCSGTCATIYGYSLNADTIHLLGMDCNYIEFIPECVKLNDGSLKIIKSPDNNPNYFFKDYQRVGDIYNPPNAERVHKQSWQDVRNIFILFNILRQKDVMLYNYNDNDTLDNYFQRKSLDELKNI